MSEGAGEALYVLGVEDGGYPRGLVDRDLRESVACLALMASALRASATLVRLFPGAHARQCALVHVCRDCAEGVSYANEMRVCGAQPR